MHPNPVFRGTETEQNLAFARERGFGVLCVQGDAEPMISHIPFLLSPDGDSADLHLVRSNPIVRALEVPRAAVIAVNGSDSYISPDWYGVEDQVPTWNYVAVHLRGQLERLSDSALDDLLDRQSEAYEARLLPKPPWKMAKMSPDAKARMMRMILPFRLRIGVVDGTWKLGQNKPDSARGGAAKGVEANGFGAETEILAQLMRKG